MTWPYQQAFYQAHPEPPWTCHFCSEEIDHRGVDGRGLSIHHIDHDHANLELPNLAPAHKACHNSYHSAMNRPSKEVRDRMSVAQRGRVFSAETREKMRVAHLGKPLPESTLTYLLTRPKEPCEVCGVQRTIGSPMANHMRIHI